MTAIRLKMIQIPNFKDLKEDRLVLEEVIFTHFRVMIFLCLDYRVFVSAGLCMARWFEIPSKYLHYRLICRVSKWNHTKELAAECDAPVFLWTKFPSCSWSVNISKNHNCDVCHWRVWSRSSREDSLTYCTRCTWNPSTDNGTLVHWLGFSLKPINNSKWVTPVMHCDILTGRLLSYFLY